MKKKLCWMFLSVVLIVGVVMAGVGKASPELVIEIEPKDNTGEPGETFSVDITVTGVVISDTPPHVSNGLFSWEAWMTFDPDVLHAVNATEGPFLESAGYPTLWRSRLDNTEGTLRVGSAIQWPYPENGSVGSGVLATLTFEVMSKGSTSLHFETPTEQARTNLYTIISDTPVKEPLTAEDGAFDNRSFTFSTELIVAIVVVVAVVCVATGLLYRRRKLSAGT